MVKRIIRVTHKRSGTLIAEGPVGWGITHFEGNLYIQKKYLLTEGFHNNWIPGLCPYKFFYVWLDLELGEGPRLSSIGWKYVLPNPMFPFIWFRVALPRHHPELLVEEFERGNGLTGDRRSGAGRSGR